MNKRSLARQVAMKCLFQMHLVKADLDEALQYFKEQESLADDVLAYAHTLASGAYTHRDEIDGIIRRHLHKWDYDRVGNVEKAILRLGVFELSRQPNTPPKVALNEAVELAKEYTTQKSVRFVNGVLDNVARELAKKPSAPRPKASKPKGPR
jgi:N utilization substance protein B